jgi:general secretion pathway protein J
MKFVRGFTLLELLVAVAIFALLGVGSYRLLASTISTRDAAKTHDNALMQLQRALTVINRDLAQTVSRPIRDEYGDSVAAVVLKMNSLELTRIGVPNPLKQVRSDLQRVNYSLNTKGELVRSTWQQLDRDRGVQAQQTVLLTKVKTISIRAHNPNGGANAEWPIVQGRADDKAIHALPRSIELIMDVQPWGEIRRLFAMPQFIEKDNSATQ